MMSSFSAENAFDKIQHSFMVDGLWQVSSGPTPQALLSGLSAAAKDLGPRAEKQQLRFGLNAPGP